MLVPIEGAGRETGTSLRCVTPSNRQLTGRQLPDSHPPVEHNLYSGRASPANARLSPRQHLPAIPLCFGRNEVFDECTRPLVGFQPRDFQKCFFVFHGYAMIAKIAHIYMNSASADQIFARSGTIDLMIRDCVSCHSLSSSRRSSHPSMARVWIDTIAKRLVGSVLPLGRIKGSVRTSSAKRSVNVTLAPVKSSPIQGRLPMLAESMR